MLTEIDRKELYQSFIQVPSIKRLIEFGEKIKNKKLKARKRNFLKAYYKLYARY